MLDPRAVAALPARQAPLVAMDIGPQAARKCRQILRRMHVHGMFPCRGRGDLSLGLGLRTLLLFGLLTASALAAEPSPWLGQVALPFAKQDVAIIGSADRKTVFASGVQRSTMAQPGIGRLLSIDVSDPRAPRQVASLPLGPIKPRGMILAGARYLLVQFERPGTDRSGILVVDVNDPTRPSRVSEFAAGRGQGFVSSDGSELLINDGISSDIQLFNLDDPAHVRIRSVIPAQRYDILAGFLQTASGSVVLLDRQDGLALVRPDAPLTARTLRPARPTDEAPEFFQLSHTEILVGYRRQLELWRAEGDEIRRVADGPPRSWMLDAVDDLLLGSAWNRPLLLWTDVRSPSPTMRVLHVPLAEVREASLLPSQKAVALVGAVGLVTVSTAPLPLDAIALRQAHRAAHRRYARDRSDVRLALALLDRAGVQELLQARPIQLSGAERIVILNDYGYWLAQNDEAEAAIAVLRKVVELAPDRAVAWANLADALRLRVRAALTLEDKQARARDVLTTYERYQAVSGRPYASMNEFRALNPATYAGDICGYVGTFFDRGRLDEIVADTDAIDVDHDGVADHVRITPRYPEIDTDRADIDFFAETEGSAPAVRMAFVPFDGKNHLAIETEHGLDRVTLANVGVVCKFGRNVTPRLSTNKDPLLCRRLLTDAVFEPVPLDRPSAIAGKDVVLAASVRERYWTVGDVETSAAVLQAGRAGAVVTLHMENPATGYEWQWLALRNGQRLDPGPLNLSLLRLQDTESRGRDTRFGLVRIAGRSYIHGAISVGDSFRHVVAQVVGDRVDTLCRTELDIEHHAQGGP